MSRFTVKALRNARIPLISKFDPSINWEAMEAQGVYFEDPPEGGELYNAKKHTDLVVCRDGETPIKFYVHSPTTKEQIVAFDMAGMEVDSESGARYLGSSGGATQYLPGNGALVGMTSACKCLALLCIDTVEGLHLSLPAKEVNAYGLKQQSDAFIQAISPVDEEGKAYEEFADVILEEIGAVFLSGDDDEAGN
jgi:hypothetical protein